MSAVNNALLDAIHRNDTDEALALLGPPPRHEFDLNLVALLAARHGNVAVLRPILCELNPGKLEQVASVAVRFNQPEYLRLVLGAMYSRRSAVWMLMGAEARERADCLAILNVSVKSCTTFDVDLGLGALAPVDHAIIPPWLIRESPHLTNDDPDNMDVLQRLWEPAGYSSPEFWTTLLIHFLADDPLTWDSDTVAIMVRVAAVLRVPFYRLLQECDSDDTYADCDSDDSAARVGPARITAGLAAAKKSAASPTRPRRAGAPTRA
jgi:hypothetical protein